MPREILEFRIVVASPSDLFETRRTVFEVIHELNRTLEAQRISIRGLGWEEYVTPGIDIDAQSVINGQLLNDYDILIALFGTRLGTPTSKSPSGTIEEIEQAIANTSSPMGKHRVQIYFLDTIDNLSSLSLEELSKVADYRKQLEPRGILYQLFKDKDQLEREIRVNIQKPILDYLRNRETHTNAISHTNRSTNKTAIEQSEEQLPQSEHTDNDIGILDIQEVAEEAINITAIAIGRITELITEIGNKTNEQVSHFEQFSFASSSAREKKKFINDFAAFIESRAAALKQEARIARENFRTFCEGAITLAELQYGENENSHNNEISSFLQAIELIQATVPENKAGVIEFRSAVINIPRITTQFNQSKKELLSALDECYEFFEQTERSISEINARIQE